MSKCVDLEVFRKTTMTYEIRFKENGIAKNITGWTVYFTVKDKLSDVDANAKVSHDITNHQDALNGITYVLLTQTDTDRTGSYYYDITYKDDEGNVGVLYHGRIKFIEKTTQRA